MVDRHIYNGAIYAIIISNFSIYHYIVDTKHSVIRNEIY